MAKNKKFRISMTQAETAFGWLYLALELFVLPLVLHKLNAQLPSPLSGAWINFVYLAVNFISAVAIFHSFLKRSVTALGKKFLPFLKAVVLGFVAWWLADLVLGTLIGLVWPGYANVNDSAIASLAGLNYPLTVIGAVVLAPWAEELFYRGLVFRGLCLQNRKAGYILSACFFAAVHIAPYWGSVSPLSLTVAFVQYLFPGLILAWTYAEADNILAPIAIHTVINAMGALSLTR